MTVLDNISFDLDLDRMIIDLRLAKRDRHIRDFTRLADEARTLARPMALYMEQGPAVMPDRSVQIAGETFNSQVLQINLEACDKVFPALATCGRKMEEWRASKTSILHQFWAKTITDAALESAVKALKRKIRKDNQIKFLSIMTPGSLMDWPLSQQKPLFRLFGDNARRIGVTLNESCLMTPESTISCLAFESENRFYTCQLCPNMDCRRRRADFDEALLKTKYQLETTDTQPVPAYEA